MNYDNWTSGEEVVLKYTKKGETLFVTYSLSKNEEYKGELNDNELIYMCCENNEEAENLIIDKYKNCIV